MATRFTPLNILERRCLIDALEIRIRVIQAGIDALRPIPQAVNYTKLQTEKACCESLLKEINNPETETGKQTDTNQ